MHIILVSNRLATAKSIVLTPTRLALGLAVLTLAVVFSSLSLSWLALRYQVPGAQAWLASASQSREVDREGALKGSLNALAKQVGTLQAQLLHLNTLGQHLTTLAGLKPGDPIRTTPVQAPLALIKGGQGGPLVLARTPEAPLSPESLARTLSSLEAQVSEQTLMFRDLEDRLMDRRIRQILLPSALPIQAKGIGSPFGRRVDPIAGVGAMHEGIDFVADVGTPVAASAGGVVKEAVHHPEYGNLIELDHGNGFSTRYAHLSKILVRPGQMINRGQEIALSGNTGRSTGPHLHFEVRYQGAAQNPAKYLDLAARYGIRVARR